MDSAHVPTPAPTPRWVYAIFGIAIAGLLGIGALFWALERSQTNQEEQRCDRAVAGREDNRAMWLYLIERLTPDRADDPDVVAFIDELNKRLPQLYCDENVPTPITTGG